MIRQTFAGHGPTVVAQALCVAQHESTYRPWVSNGGNDGLFQLDRYTWDPARNPRALPIVGPVSWARIYEPAVNARVALAIYRHSGWLPAWNADARACSLTH